jgi:hypothetical protein
VAELRVPGIVEDPFREHYRALVMGSLLRAAEAQTERHRLRGHKLRARRAERVAQRLRPVQTAPPVLVREPERVAREPVAAPTSVEAPRTPGVAYEPWFGTTIRRAAAVVWFATLAALVANVLVLGIESPATVVADLGLIAMTFVWFAASIDDLIEPPRERGGSGAEAPLPFEPATSSVDSGLVPGLEART